MGKYEKLVQKIFSGKANITPAEAMKILERLGFKASSTCGSHRTFRKPERPSVTIVLTQNPLKSYLVEKLQKALNNEGYYND